MSEYYCPACMGKHAEKECPLVLDAISILRDVWLQFSIENNGVRNDGGLSVLEDVREFLESTAKSK